MAIRLTIIMIVLWLCKLPFLLLYEACTLPQCTSGESFTSLMSGCFELSNIARTHSSTNCKKDFELAVLSSIEQMEQLGSGLSTGEYYHVAVSYQSGDFRWSDGSAVQANMWMSGEPTGATDQCGALSKENSTRLVMVTCKSSFKYVCGAPDGSCTNDLLSFSQTTYKTTLQTSEIMTSMKSNIVSSPLNTWSITNNTMSSHVDVVSTTSDTTSSSVDSSSITIDDTYSSPSESVSRTNRNSDLYSETLMTSITSKPVTVNLTSSKPVTSRSVTTSSSCRCRCSNNQKANNLSASQLMIKVNELKTSLAVAKDTLSAKLRHKTSASDDRMTATAAGIVGVTVLVVVFMIFLAMDLEKFVSDVTSSRFVSAATVGKKGASIRQKAKLNKT